MLHGEAHTLPYPALSPTQPSLSLSPPHPSPKQEHLSLEANTLCTLPPAVAALPALRHLDLGCNPLSWLPTGPYLRTVETLILSGNRFSQVSCITHGVARK